MSGNLRLKGRQSLSVSHREREIVPDGRTNERKGALSLEPFTLFGIQKMGESAEERRVRDGVYLSLIHI